MFLIMINYTKPFEIVEKYVLAHREYLDQCYKRNCLIVSGPRNPRTGGVMLSQLTNREELAEIINNDPFKVNDVASFEIIEFMPVRHHPDFSSFIVK